jgi:hypothetical protein
VPPAVGPARPDGTPPPGAEAAAAQAHTVLRYLVSWAPVRNAAVAGRRQQVFFGFLAQGLHEGWDAAARGYGFADAAGLEGAWLAWMDSPESVVRVFVPRNGLLPAPAPAVVVPPTIPPTRVRDQ